MMRMLQLNFLNIANDLTVILIVTFWTYLWHNFCLRFQSSVFN